MNQGYNFNMSSALNYEFPNVMSYDKLLVKLPSFN